ncbi:MAG: tetratricopeptide repeat protein [Bacteroidia bacterium]
MRYFLIMGLLLSQLGQPMLAQSSRNQALALARRAVKVMQKGQAQDAQSLFMRALALDPSNIHIQYQLALLYYNESEYQLSCDILKETTRDPEAPLEHFAFLGNAFDNLDQEEEALKAYKRGLRKYPNSGRLYAELGILALNHNHLREAISYWEQGINLDPNYAPNYYWASKAYANTAERLWALLYGEVFMLLVPNDTRTDEISAMLLDNYSGCVEVLGDESVLFRLSLKAYTRSSSQDRIPFIRSGPPRSFEQAFVERFQASGAQFSLGLTDPYAIASARTAFNLSWREKESLTELFPNDLFLYWERLEAAGHWEAYHFWLLQAGEPGAFRLWATTGQNDMKLASWLNWQKQNPLFLEKEQRINRLRFLE